MFIYNTNGVRVYFLAYVDDISITGSHNAFISHLIDALSAKFPLKDLGALNYFLGVELVQTTTGILISQHSYIRDLLQRFGMCDAKAVGTPLSSLVTLQLNDGEPPVDSTLYRQLLGKYAL